jgi:hypothetical protein
MKPKTFGDMKSLCATCTGFAVKTRLCGVDFMVIEGDVFHCENYQQTTTDRIAELEAELTHHKTNLPGVKQNT